jgi:hypothetical protein
MENFRVTTGYGFKGFRSFRTWRQDKGHRAEIAAFVDGVRSCNLAFSSPGENGDTIGIGGHDPNFQGNWVMSPDSKIGSCPQIPGCAPLIPFDQIVNTTRASFAAVESARTGSAIKLIGLM